MEIFRHGHDAWGQPVIYGLAWNLLDFAVGIGLAVIVIHFIFRVLTSARRRRN